MLTTDVGDKANNHLIISGNGTNYQTLDDPDVDAIFLAFGSKDSYIQIISSLIVCPITLINVGYLLIIFSLTIFHKCLQYLGSCYNSRYIVNHFML